MALILQGLEQEFGIELDLYDNGDYLTLSRIVVPKDSRGGGIGKQAMQKIVDYADEVGKPIYLTPSKDFGATSKSRLEKFYKEFGFKKKPREDFRTREAMVRYNESANEMKFIVPFKQFLNEKAEFNQWFALNEVGDASAKPFKWKPFRKIKDQMVKAADKVLADNRKDGEYDSLMFEYFFKNDDGIEYVCSFSGWIQNTKSSATNFFDGKYNPAKAYDSSFNVSFNTTEDYMAGVENETNMNEMFRIMATVTEITFHFLEESEAAGFPVKNINVVAKGDGQVEFGTDTRRGRIYLAYIKKQMKRLTTKSKYTAIKTRETGTDRNGKSISGEVIKIRLGDWKGSGVVETADVGKKLLADDEFAASVSRNHDRFYHFIDVMYRDEGFEDNTKYEKQLVRYLQDYFRDEKNSTNLAKVLNSLLKIKNKFPKLLDPTTSKRMGDIKKWMKNRPLAWYGNVPSGMIWRGAKMPMKELERLLPKTHKLGDKFDFAIGTDKPGIKYSSKNKSGFTSWTVDPTSAVSFAKKRPDNEAEKVAVIYGCKADNPRFLLSPDLSNSISKYGEDEVFLMGTAPIKVDFLVIIDERVQGNFISDLAKREKEEGLPEFTLRTDAENFDKWKVTNPLRFQDFDWIGGEKSNVTYRS